MPQLDFLEVTEMRAQQEGKVSRCQAEGTSVSWASFLTLLLGPWDDYLSFGLLAGRTVDFGRQGITVELFARAVLARLTTLLALSSPGGCAAKKKQGESCFLSRVPAGRASLPFSCALVPQTSFRGAPIAACILTAAFLPFLPQCRRPRTLIFRQKCCNN